MSCPVQDTFAHYTQGDYHGTSYPVQATMARSAQRVSTAAPPDEPALKIPGNKKYMNLIRQMTRYQLSPSPFWKTYVGSPSYHRRRHDSRHAASLQIFNAELCGIYRLPLELILQIVQLLPALDMFCLRMTSRRFAAIIKRKDIQANKDTYIPGDVYPKADIYAQAEMEARVLRDRFTKRADAEVVTAHSPDRLLCWPCRTSHPRHYFDSTEIYQSGRVRRCQGHICLLQVCPHLYLTRGEVLARVTQAAGNMPSIDCPVSWGSGGCAYRPSWIKEIQTYIPGSRKFVVQIMFGQSLMYKTLGERRIFYRSDMKDMLLGVAARICPHMNTHDREFLLRFNATPASRMCGSQRISEAHVEKIFGKEDDLMAIRVPCEVEDCDTYLEVEKLTYEGSTNLHFTVTRNLGKMDEPLDGKWLVQCGVGSAQ